jgi:RHS repeat-associated protein
MGMPGRTYSATTGYRYGFNGKEIDNEVAGETNSLDFGARIYNPRLGRWLAVDPLQGKYPNLSPYNFCANSPLAAKDPDGRLIIFINGLWTPGTNVGQPGPGYWNSPNYDWIADVQEKIGDHAQPRFYDGSLGGSLSLGINIKSLNPMFEPTRIATGRNVGHEQAAAIIGNLTEGETIKIVTNSMGTAFARGFTKGILEYQGEENKRRTEFNSEMDRRLAPLLAQKIFLEGIQAAAGKSMERGTKRRIARDIADLNSKISDLESRKKEMLDVKFEMEIDLSSHQTDYANPDVQKSYYMTTNNFPGFEKLVRQKEIKGAENLGTMSVHHSSGAHPNQFPISNTPDPNPPKR